MEGISLKPLLTDPTRKWKTVAFSQYHRNPRVSPDANRYMGYSMITPRYHYIQWREWDHESGVAGNVVAVELYDHQTDSDENTNVADLAENRQLVEQLAKQIETDWPTGVLSPHPRTPRGANQ
jgi:iduronate 2-sulfatase